MGWFYHLICKILNFILSLREEPLINPDKSKMKIEYPIHQTKKKNIISPFLSFTKKIKKHGNTFPINNVRFTSNLITLENFFTKYRNIFFLKNNKLYNKGRYSRNKQTYRTGVIWCLWLTVVSVAGSFYYFYSFTFKFTYLWIIFFIFVSKLIYNYAVKHNYFNSWKLFYFFSSLFKNNI